MLINGECQNLFISEDYDEIMSNVRENLKDKNI